MSSKWSANLEVWKDTSKNGTYSPGRVVSIHDGVLDKYLHSENGSALVAAIVPKIPTIGVSTSGVPNTPMHWVLQTETALRSTPPSPAIAGHLLIDWVTVYVPR